MDRIIQSPGKYIQGAGAIKRLGGPDLAVSVWDAIEARRVKAA